MIADSALLLAELVVLFFVVAFAVQLIQIRVGATRLQRWMGGPPILAALKGIAAGFVTPFCTYSAVPLLVGLRRAGVPPAGYVAFIAAAPVLDPVLFGALVLIAGPAAALVYSSVALAGALTLGMIAGRPRVATVLDSAVRTHPSPVRVGSGVEPVAHGHPTAPDRGGCHVAGDRRRDGGSGSVRPARSWDSLRRETVRAAIGAVDLLRSTGGILVVGVAIGLVIETLVVPADVATLTGSGGWSIPAAAALGVPLYVHTGLFVPIADSLAGAGVGIGAIVALTIAGAGANVPEFIILSALVGRRPVVAFAGYVFALAVAGGLVAQALLG